METFLGFYKNGTKKETNWVSNSWFFIEQDSCSTQFADRFNNILNSIKLILRHHKYHRLNPLSPTIIKIQLLIILHQRKKIIVLNLNLEPISNVKKKKEKKKNGFAHRLT